MPYAILHRPKGKPRERLLLIGGFEEDFYAALKRTDLLVEEVLSGQEALRCAAQREYGVVICSLRMSGAWGLDVLDAIRKADPLTPVIISTHEQNPKVVVEAMQHGAYDYIIEPHGDLPGVLRLIERAVRRRAALHQGRALQEALAGEKVRFFEGLIGRSPAFRELCERIRQAAPTPSPVLIEGESGTGKELVARAVHQASSRRLGPFVAVHCGAIPENLLESELFGHEKGAFTGAEATRVGVFEAAHGGTLFLDEIGLTSPACQAKLLRVLENGVVRRVGANRELCVDVRILSATNAPLEKMIASQRFRQDLYYRLNVVALKTPSLRERREDIPLLAHHFAQRFAREAGKPFEAFSQQALAALQRYRFPGNVRELRNIAERSVVFIRGPVIRAADLPEAVRARSGPGSAAEEAESEPPVPAWTAAGRAHVLQPGGTWSLEERLAAVEKALLEQALAQAGGNRTRAAKLLKVKRTTLLEKMARLGLSLPVSSPNKKSPGPPKPQASPRRPRGKKPTKAMARKRSAKRRS